MRGVIRYIALLAATLVVVGELSAQNSYSAYGYGQYVGSAGSPRSSVEMGVAVGASYMLLDADGVELNPQIGVRGALEMSLCWDEQFALQMELAYIFNKLKASLPSIGKSEQMVKNGVFDIPILFSYRGLGPLRLNVGPVLSLAGTARYDLPEERIEFGRLRPTLALAAGVGVELSKHIVLAARYVSSFKRTSNYFDGAMFEPQGHWLMFNFGYVF